MLLDFKLVLDRTDGYGMKIQKFHQQIDGPANIDYLGLQRMLMAGHVRRT